MASSQKSIRIGYVPEHFLAPLHLALHESSSILPFNVSLVPFPSGTGHMITSLREDEIDIAIGLTEGWIAGLVGKDQMAKNEGAEAGGYKMIGQWVETPLRWAIVTGRDRDEIQGVEDLKGGRVGVSRLGSGSHTMSFLLAQQQNWSSTAPLTTVPLGPFPALCDGVRGTTSSADFFMWEHFTTKPSFHVTPSSPSPPLKKIGEIFTPWPSWHIAASASTFPSPATDVRLSQLFDALDAGIASFESDPIRVVKKLGTGEMGCTYSEEDAREWLKDVKFRRGTRGVDRNIVDGVVDLLQGAGVVGNEVGKDEAVERVVGILR